MSTKYTTLDSKAPVPLGTRVRRKTSMPFEAIERMLDGTLKFCEIQRVAWLFGFVGAYNKAGLCRVKLLGFVWAGGLTTTRELQRIPTWIDGTTHYFPVFGPWEVYLE